MIFDKKTMQSNRHLCRKPKRFRSVFTTDQINYLEQLFKKFPYIDKDQRKEAAAFLRIGERPIKIWFQNRRMKEKRENYKEFDVEINSHPQEFDNDQLNNVPAMPSTNDYRSYSLPMLTSIKDTTANANIFNMKVNNDEQKITITNTENVPNLKGAVKTSHPNGNSNRKMSNQEHHWSPYFYLQPTNTSLPLVTNVKNLSTPSQKQKNNKASAELSINLCKRYKQKSVASNTTVYGDNDTNQEKMAKELKEIRRSKEDTQYYRPSEEYTFIKIPQLSYMAPPKAPKQNLNNPAFYSAMPTMYAPPFMSPGGLFWNPVNIVPDMAINAPPVSISNCQGPSTHGKSKNCKCNCHGSG